MPTYVYSLRANAQVVHLGTPDAMLCNRVLTSFFKSGDEYPAGRRLCPQCARAAGVQQTKIIRVHSLMAERDRALVELLRDGHGRAGIARRLRLGLRTFSNMRSQAMWRAKVRTDWQWGHKIGYAEGVRDALGWRLDKAGVYHREPPEATELPTRLKPTVLPKRGQRLAHGVE